MNIRKKIALYLTDKFNSATNCILYDSIEDLKNLNDPTSIVAKGLTKVEKKPTVPRIRTDDSIKEEWIIQTVTVTNNTLVLKFKLNFRKNDKSAAPADKEQTDNIDKKL